MFKDSDYEFLQIIECLKATGMPLKDIKEFIYMVQRGNESIGDRLQLFYKQKAEVEKQIVSLQKTLDVINFKCWYYETAKKAGTTEVPDHIPDNELSDEIREIRMRLRGEERTKKSV